jgi:shikimate O-hydroxycinnamoyltransferase
MRMDPKVNDGYFKSLIDFVSSDIISKEGLVTTTVMDKKFYSPNLEVDSCLTFPLFDLDFGTSSPHYFMPTYFLILRDCCSFFLLSLEMEALT